MPIYLKIKTLAILRGGTGQGGHDPCESGPLLNWLQGS